MDRWFAESQKYRKIVKDLIFIVEESKSYSRDLKNYFLGREMTTGFIFYSSLASNIIQIISHRCISSYNEIMCYSFI